MEKKIQQIDKKDEQIKNCTNICEIVQSKMLQWLGECIKNSKIAKNNNGRSSGEKKEDLKKDGDVVMQNIRNKQIINYKESQGQEEKNLVRLLRSDRQPFIYLINNFATIFTN